MVCVCVCVCVCLYIVYMDLYMNNGDDAADDDDASGTYFPYSWITSPQKNPEFAGSGAREQRA